MPDATKPRTFRAFISYRHADNAEDGRRWAHWLHQELERYQVPRDMIGKPNSFGEPVPEHLFPIFRDEEEMRAGEDLGALIADALERSDWLVVLCSPRSARSRYVRREILQFKLLGKSDRILPVIIEGEPGAAQRSRSGEAIEAALECFPLPLRRGIPIDGQKDHRGRALIDWRRKSELLAADLRPEGTRGQGHTSAAAYRADLETRNGLLPTAQQLTTKQLRTAEQRYAEQLERQTLKIIAGLLGVDLGELTKRDAAARARRLRRLLMTSVAVLLLVAGLAMVAVYQEQVASSNLASSRYTLSHVAADEHGDPSKALLLASSAVEAAPSIDPLMDVYARRAEVLALASPRYIKAADHAQVAIFSPKLDKVAIIDGGRVRIRDLLSGRSVHVPSLTEANATVASFTIPAFSHDGSHFVAGIDANRASSWRLLDGKAVTVASASVIVRGTLQSQYYFSPDGRSVLGWVGVETGDEDGQHANTGWDVESGKPASTEAVRDVFRFGALTWSRDPARNWAVVALDSRRVQVIDVSNGEKISPEFEPAAEGAQVVSMALSPDAQWLVTATRGELKDRYQLRLWSTWDGKPAELAPMQSTSAPHIQDVSRDGRRVLVTADAQDMVVLQLWEFGRPSYPNPYRELGSFTSPQSLWTAVWGTGRLASFCGDTDLVAAISVEPAAWTAPGPRIQSRFAIRLWDAQTARELTYSIRSAGGLVAWGVSPDGRRIGTVTADGVVTTTDLYWHQPSSASAVVSGGDLQVWKANRAWFAGNVDAAVIATTQGIQYVGGMPTSSGQPKMLLQNWRLPKGEPVWKEPLVVSGDAMALSSAVVAWSPDDKRLVLGTSDIRVVDAASGALAGPPFPVRGHLRGVTFVGDGERIAIASQTAGKQGETLLRIEQRDLRTGEEVRDVAIELRNRSEDAAVNFEFAGFTADGSHFMRTSAGERSTSDWSMIEQIELLDLRQALALRLRFTRESPAPPGLVAAVVQAARSVTVVSTNEVIANLQSAKIRVRAVPAGATLAHVEAKRAIVAPRGISTSAVPPIVSADGRWIAMTTPSGREVQIWSALTGMPLSEPIVHRSQLLSIAFDASAEHIWHLGGNRELQSTYIGTGRAGKPPWLAFAAEALTGSRLTGQGMGVEWLPDRQRGAAEKRLLESLANESKPREPEIARIKERLGAIGPN